MKLTPFRLGAQRRHVQALAVAAVERQRAAEHNRQQAAAGLRARAVKPQSLLLALMAGLVVGMLAPQDRKRTDTRAAGAAAGAEPDQGQQKQRPITHNAAVQQLLRAGRAYLAGRVARSLTS